MTGYGLPHAFGSRHLESRDGFPIKWEGATEEEASTVARALHESMVDAKTDGLFLVVRAGKFVTVERTSDEEREWAPFYRTPQTEDHTFGLHGHYETKEETS